MGFRVHIVSERRFCHVWPYKLFFQCFVLGFLFVITCIVDTAFLVS